MEGARALYDFHGRTGIVTGAGSGIGRATALLLASRAQRSWELAVKPGRSRKRPRSHADTRAGYCRVSPM